MVIASNMQKAEANPVPPVFSEMRVKVKREYGSCWNKDVCTVQASTGAKLHAAI